MTAPVLVEVDAEMWERMARDLRSACRRLGTVAEALDRSDPFRCCYADTALRELREHVQRTTEFLLYAVWRAARGTLADSWDDDS